MREPGRDWLNALRATWRAPQYVAPVVLTLAVGIGGNAAVFTIVNAILFRPLPYADAEQLVQIWNVMRDPPDPEMTVAPADYLDFRARAHSFTDMAAHNIWLPPVGDAAAAERGNAGVVTPNFFSVVGITPMLGRQFRDGENYRTGDRVLLLSYGAWQRRFAADPHVVGKVLQIGGLPFEVVGVLPQRYRHPDPRDPLRDAEFFAPISFSPGAAARDAQSLRVIGRLRPGVSLEQGRREVASIARDLATEYPVTNHDRDATVRGLRDNFFAGIRKPLLIAQVAALLVLLVACSNLANLAVVRAHGRRREFAIRTSLGASRIRLARQLLVEHLTLALLGGVLALGCLMAGVGALRSLQGRFVPVIAVVNVDGVVVGFTVLLCLVATVGFGLLPLLEVRDADLREVLAEESAGAGGSPRSQGVRQILVMAEVAMAVALVVGTGVLARSLNAQRHVDPGFDAAHVLTFEVVLSPTRYAIDDTARTAGFFRALATRLSALPGVTSVAQISDLPLTWEYRTIGMRVEGNSRTNEAQLRYQLVSGAYFQTVGIPIVRGRTFLRTDGRNAAIVSEALARRLWPNQDPVGRRLVLEDEQSYAVVGLVRDIVHRNLTTAPEPILYLPPGAEVERHAFIALRTGPPPLGLARAARDEVRQLDASAAVMDMRVLDDVVRQQLGQPRFAAGLSTLFSSLALGLAALGIYGVLTYTVTARGREIGIRTALGADPARVTAMVVRQGLTLVLPGVLAGAVLGIEATRVLASLLFGVGTLDPLSFGGAAAVLITVGLLASWIPARRAARISPMRAIMG